MNYLTIVIDYLIVVATLIYFLYGYISYIVTIQHCVYGDYQCKICKDDNTVCDRRKKVRF